MKLKEKIKLTRYLKSESVQRQLYDFAALLRDKERSLLKEFESSVDLNRRQFHHPHISHIEETAIKKPETIEEYNFVMNEIKLYNESRKEEGFVGEFELLGLDNLKNKITKDCLPILREEKLNKLFN